MSLLLGCLCFDNQSASEIADVLSRSGVRVNQRQLQSLNALDATVIAPFEIIVLNSVDRDSSESTASLIDKARLAWNWCTKHDAKRCLLHYPSGKQSAHSDHLGLIADALLALMPHRGPCLTVYCPSALPGSSSTGSTTHSSPLPNTATTATRLPQLNDTNDLFDALNDQLDNSVGFIDRSIVQQGPLAIVQSMDGFILEKIHHVVMDAQDSNDFLNVIRGTEQLSLLVGSSAMGLHLPALFRIRGWLRDSDQIVPASQDT